MHSPHYEIFVYKGGMSTNPVKSKVSKGEHTLDPLI